MAERFNITAQLQLQAPTNVNAVVRSINKQLGSVGSLDLKVKSDPRALALANKQIQNVGKSMKTTQRSTEGLNRTLQESARRFSVITIATGTLLALANSFKNSIKSAVAFEREMVRISQVTGKTVNQLQGLSDEVTRLSTTLGASNSELLLTARTLSQAGFSAEKTRKALDILAKTTLGATFDSLQDTTEGAIALLRQFRNEALKSGGDIKFLENSLDAINSVSKNFAVESGDLVTAIRRVGGVFSAAGGSVNELIALFTSVRSTTRESAETIATGLRTIFTRIQRVETVDQLKQLGVQLQDSRGQFVGAFEAFRRLSTGLSALDPRDFRFSQIVEQLGGFRQIGKVIPLIQQFTVAQDALSVAQAASGSVSKDAQTAQSALATQLDKTRQSFDALIRKFSESEGFQSIVRLALSLADAFLKIASSLEPLIPLLGVLFATKVGAGFGKAVGSFLGVSKTATGGGAVTKFARGGFVPGTGSSDTVPAMLTPGEFVIRKSSVNKLGAGQLNAMNNNGYAAGGAVSGIVALRPWEENPTVRSGSENITRKSVADRTRLGITGARLGEYVKENPSKFGGYFGGILGKFGRSGNINVKTLGTSLGDDVIGGNFEGKITKDFVDSVNKRSGIIGRFFGAEPSALNFADAQNLGIESIIGNAFEAVMTTMGTPFGDKGGNSAAFDFIRGIGQSIADRLGVGELASNPTDAKRTLTGTNLRESATKKFANQLAAEFISGYKPQKSDTGYKKTSLDNFFTQSGKTKQGLSLQDFRSTRGTIAGGFTDITAAELKDKGFTKRGSKYFAAGYASGGSVAGSDTVPAMLTPGEFVVSRSSAQSIGYGNLNRMNKLGVTGYANGGVVGYNRGAKVRDQRGKLEHNMLVAGPSNAFTQMGGEMGAKAATQEINELKAVFEEFGLVGDDLAQAMGTVTDTFREGGSQLDAYDAAIDQLNATIDERAARGEVRIPTDERLSADAGLAGGVFAANAEERKGLKGAIQAGPQEDQRMVQNQVAALQQREMQAIAAKIQTADITTTEEEALARAYKVVQQKYGQLATTTDVQVASAADLEKSQESLSEKIKKRAGALGKAVTPEGLGTAENRQAFGEQAGKMAGAAQQFVFLAGAATALTSQFSGLDDATKSAINQTVAFASSIVGVGATLVQTITSFMTNAALSQQSERVETQANLEAAASEKMKIGANVKSSASGAKLATSFGIVAFAIVGAISALNFFSARNKAIADQAKKDFDAAGKAISEGETQDTSTLKNAIKEEAEARQRAALQFSNSSMAGVAAITAAGGALGAVGGPIGVAVGAVIGATVGVVTALTTTEMAMQAQADARQRELDSMNYLIDSFAALSSTTRSVKDAMATITGTEGLSDERRLGLIQEQVDRGLDSGIGAAGQTGVSAQFNSVQNEMRGIASRLGTSGTDLIGADDAKIQELAKAQGLNAAETTAVLNKFKLAVMSTEAAMSAAQQNLQFASEGMAIALKSADPTKTFDELIAQGGAFAKSFEQQAFAIQEMGDIQERAARKEVEDVREMTDDRDKISAAEQKYQAVVQQSEQKLALFAEGVKQSLIIREKERQAIAAAAAAQINLVKKLEETAKAREKIELRGAKLEADAQQARDLQAAARGETTEFRVADIKGFDDITNVTDTKQLNRSISNLARSTGDPAIAREGVELSRAVTAISKSRNLVGRNLELSEDLVPEDILKSVGITRDDFGSNQGAFDQAVEALKEQRGKITQADIEKIFGGLIEQAEAQAGVFKGIVDNQRKELDLQRVYLDGIQQQRNREIEIAQKMNDVRAKNTEILLKARGVEATPEVRQRARVVAAQNRLDAGRLGRGGVEIRANDITGTTAQRNTAIEGLKQIEKQKRLNEESNRSEQEKLRVNRQLMKKQQQLSNVVSDTTAELERMATQAAAAADIQAGIDRERANRAQQTKLVEDFVVGGEDQRRKMLDAAQGVFQAIQQGTLQNQSPEQRQDTVALLDRLGDFMVGTTGMTAKQIKKELIFKDAIQMGLPPDVAKALALGTTKEEQLINALDRLTSATERATGAAAGAALTAASGGVVYRAGGGSIFKPRGTDTVPAMLTPGEFVVRKSAVDKVGVGNLQAINNGGTPVYRQQGGPIGAGNAGFAGQTSQISIMSGSQYLQLVRNSLRAFGTARNLANFIKSSDKPRPIVGADQIAKDIRFLASKGEFNISKVVAGKQTANSLDAIAGSPLLVSASGSGLGLKPPPFDPTKNDKDTRSVARNYKMQLEAMLTSMNLGGANIKANQDPSEQLASRVVMKATGMNIYGMVASSLRKVERMRDLIDEYLAGNMDQGKMKSFRSAVQSIQGLGGDEKAAAGQVSEMTGKKLTDRVATAINNLKGRGIYMNTGGGVSGNDSVPAMLTPGEFVMSPEAVQKHGVGFMRNLNRGKVKGFRRGGLVGGVAYRANGSSGAEGGGSAALTIDSSQLQETLAGFSANFQSSVDNVVAQFSLVSTAMNGLATAIGQGMTLNHVFSGDMTLAFNIQNGDHLKNMIADAITPKISEIIANELDQRLNKDFEAG